MSEIVFEYAGELGDPDQAPLTASVYECSACGALVKSSGQERHREWHAFPALVDEQSRVRREGEQ